MVALGKEADVSYNKGKKELKVKLDEYRDGISKISKVEDELKVINKNIKDDKLKLDQLLKDLEPKVKNIKDTTESVASSDIDYSAIVNTASGSAAIIGLKAMDVKALEKLIESEVNVASTKGAKIGKSAMKAFALKLQPSATSQKTANFMSMHQEIIDLYSDKDMNVTKMKLMTDLLSELENKINTLDDQLERYQKALPDDNFTLPQKKIKELKDLYNEDKEGVKKAILKLPEDNRKVIDEKILLQEKEKTVYETLESKIKVAKDDDTLELLLQELKECAKRQYENVEAAEAAKNILLDIKKNVTSGHITTDKNSSGSLSDMLKVGRSGLVSVNQEDAIAKFEKIYNTYEKCTTIATSASKLSIIMKDLSIALKKATELRKGIASLESKQEALASIKEQYEKASDDTLSSFYTKACNTQLEVMLPEAMLKWKALEDLGIKIPQKFIDIKVSHFKKMGLSDYKVLYLDSYNSLKKAMSLHEQSRPDHVEAIRRSIGGTLEDVLTILKNYDVVRAILNDSDKGLDLFKKETTDQKKKILKDIIDIGMQKLEVQTNELYKEQMPSIRERKKIDQQAKFFEIDNSTKEILKSYIDLMLAVDKELLSELADIQTNKDKVSALKTKSLGDVSAIKSDISGMFFGLDVDPETQISPPPPPTSKIKTSVVSTLKDEIQGTKSLNKFVAKAAPVEIYTSGNTEERLLSIEERAFVSIVKKEPYNIKGALTEVHAGTTDLKYTDLDLKKAIFYLIYEGYVSSKELKIDDTLNKNIETILNNRSTINITLEAFETGVKERIASNFLKEQEISPEALKIYEEVKSHISDKTEVEKLLKNCSEEKDLKVVLTKLLHGKLNGLAISPDVDAVLKGLKDYDDILFKTKVLDTASKVVPELENALMYKWIDASYSTFTSKGLQSLKDQAKKEAEIQQKAAEMKAKADEQVRAQKEKEQEDKKLQAAAKYASGSDFNISSESVDKDDIVYNLSKILKDKNDKIYSTKILKYVNILESYSQDNLSDVCAKIKPLNAVILKGTEGNLKKWFETVIAEKEVAKLMDYITKSSLHKQYEKNYTEDKIKSLSSYGKTLLQNELYKKFISASSDELDKAIKVQEFIEQGSGGAKSYNPNDRQKAMKVVDDDDDDDDWGDDDASTAPAPSTSTGAKTLKQVKEPSSTSSYYKALILKSSLEEQKAIADLEAERLKKEQEQEKKRKEEEEKRKDAEELAKKEAAAKIAFREKIVKDKKDIEQEIKELREGGISLTNVISKFKSGTKEKQIADKELKIVELELQLADNYEDILNDKEITHKQKVFEYLIGKMGVISKELQRLSNFAKKESKTFKDSLSKQEAELKGFAKYLVKAQSASSSTVLSSELTKPVSEAQDAFNNACNTAHVLDNTFPDAAELLGGVPPGS